MQAAFQALVDNGAPKTVNLPAAAGVEAVREVSSRPTPWALRGSPTVFRHDSRGRQVLELAPLPGQDEGTHVRINDHCPRCGGQLATDGGCRTYSWCGASGCE